MNDTCPECGAPVQDGGQWLDLSPRVKYVASRSAYVMAMAILQSSLYASGDDELRAAVDGALPVRSSVARKA